MIEALEKKDLRKVEFSIDQVGKVLFYEDRVFRGISDEYVASVREMFDCGMIEELVNKQLLVKTWISETRIEDYTLVLEHERIPFWNYPYDWPPTMLYRAANVVLDANEVANKYGYELFDGHSFNVVFDMTRPKYVDIGSFFKRDIRNNKCWPGYLMFYNSFYLPLYLYNKGFSDLPNSIVLYNGHFNYKDFFLIRYKYSQLLGRKLNNICYQLYDKTRRLAVARYASILAKYGDHKHIDKLLKFKKLYQNRFTPAKARRLVKGVSKSKINFSSTDFKNTKKSVNEKHLARIAALIQTEFSAAYSLVELASKGDKFANYVLAHTQIEKVIITTFDKNILEQIFISNESRNDVLPLLYDFIRPNNKCHKIKINRRIKADIVVLLDVTNHLLLTQDVPLDYIFKTLATLTNKYIMIDFMPLGIDSDDMDRVSRVPDYYTLAWFKSSFLQKFELIFDEKMALNKHLFIGELRA